MTIVTYVAIHPHPGVQWGEVQKQLKTSCDLARKHGAENVTVLATTVGVTGGEQADGVGRRTRTGRSTARPSRRYRAILSFRKPCSRLARSAPGRRTSARRSTCNAPRCK